MQVITKFNSIFRIQSQMFQNLKSRFEIQIIKDIIIDFFNLEPSNIDDLIQNNLKVLEVSTDFYEFGKILNENFTYQDKIDFICCTYEVAFIDNEMHYHEDHIIKKISYILNVEHQDLIKAKNEIKNLFK